MPRRPDTENNCSRPRPGWSIHTPRSPSWQDRSPRRRSGPGGNWSRAIPAPRWFPTRRRCVRDDSCRCCRCSRPCTDRRRVIFQATSTRVCRLLRADRRPGAELTRRDGRTANFSAGPDDAADRVQEIIVSRPGQAGRSSASITVVARPITPSPFRSWWKWSRAIPAQCWFPTRGDEVREVVAAAVGVPDRILIGARDPSRRPHSRLPSAPRRSASRRQTDPPSRPPPNCSARGRRRRCTEEIWSPTRTRLVDPAASITVAGDRSRRRRSGPGGNGFERLQRTAAPDTTPMASRDSCRCCRCSRPYTDRRRHLSRRPHSRLPSAPRRSASTGQIDRPSRPRRKSVAGGPTRRRPHICPRPGPGWSLLPTRSPSREDGSRRRR